MACILRHIPSSIDDFVPEREVRALATALERAHQGLTAILRDRHRRGLHDDPDERLYRQEAYDDAS
jgi:hypothetical protein